MINQKLDQATVMTFPSHKLKRLRNRLVKKLHVTPPMIAEQAPNPNPDAPTIESTQKKLLLKLAYIHAHHIIPNGSCTFTLYGFSLFEGNLILYVMIHT